MNTDDYINNMILRKEKVIKTESGFWQELYRGVFTSIPFYKPINPPKSELYNILLKTQCLAIKFVSDKQSGEPISLLNCNKKPYDLSVLQKKARNQTRRGLEVCKIYKMNLKEISDLGYDLNIGTLARQGRNSKQLKISWEKNCERMILNLGYEFWGATINSQLAAFIGFVQLDDSLSIMIQRSSQALLKFYPNNALTYEITRMALMDRSLTYVTYGLESIEKIPSLDNFKINMGYEKIPVFQRIIINPILIPIVKLIPNFIANQIANILPFGSKMRKACLLVPSIKSSN
jgi:hypothetical protein